MLFYFKNLRRYKQNVKIISQLQMECITILKITIQVCKIETKNSRNSHCYLSIQSLNYALKPFLSSGHWIPNLRKSIKVTLWLCVRRVLSELHYKH